MNQKRGEDMKKRVLFCSVAFALVLLLNIFPRFAVEGILYAEDAVPVSYAESFLNDREFSYSDWKSIEGGGYLLAYRDSLSTCCVTSSCDYVEDWFASRIVRFDSTGDAVWELGRTLACEGGIQFENRDFTARAVALLTDGTTVAAGWSLEPSLQLLRQGILFIDAQGVPFELMDIDSSSYGFSNFLLQLSQEIVGTADGGFTLQLSGQSSGSVLIHFGADGAEEWHTGFYPYVFEGTDSLPPEGGFIEALNTLQYAGGNHYAVIGNAVHAFDMTGAPLWKTEFPGYLTSFRVTEAGELFVTGFETPVIRRPLTPFLTVGPDLTVRNIYTEILLGEDGTSRWHGDFYYGWDEKRPSGACYAWEDPDGSVYAIIAKSPGYQDTDYSLLVVKYHSTGHFAGTTTLRGVLETGSESKALTQTGQMGMRFLGEDAEILIPTLGSNPVFTPSELPFADPMPLAFDLDFYHFFLIFRVILDWTIVAAAVTATVRNELRLRAAWRKAQGNVWTRNGEE